MNPQKILLIQPKTSWRDKVYSYGWCPPLGLMSLASYVQQEFPEIKIKIVDEEIEEVKEWDGDVLGLSCNLGNYGRALQIAEQFKRKNPVGKIIIGGPHSVLAGNILKNRKIIDAVVCGFDGEESFAKFVGGKKLKDIPNLVWRENGEVVQNTRKFFDLQSLPIPDRGLVNLRKYFQNFSDPNFSRPTIIYTTKGCPHGKCAFCVFSGQKEIKFRTRNFEQIWQEICNLQKNFGVDYIWNVADSPTKNWFLGLLKTKPKNVNIALRFYARSKEVDEDTVKVLRELNTYEVFLGIESGDDEILERMQKGENTADHVRAVKNLVKNNIKPRVAFILGSEGETKKTLEKSYKFAKTLFNLGADSIACSIFTPIPGSTAYQKLIGVDKFRLKNENKDLLESSYLQKEWVRYFTEVDYKLIKKFIEKFKMLSPRWGRGF